MKVEFLPKRPRPATRRRLTIAEIDRMKDPLRQAVAFRQWEGKLSVLHLVTGIPEDRLRAFVETGEIGQMDRMTLEMFKE